MKKLLISAMIVAGTAFGISGQAQAACGEFQMSDMNWPSATLMANVDKIILEEGYGDDSWCNNCYFRNDERER